MIDDRELREIALRYFKAWNQHNVQELKLLMSDNIKLVDWEIICEGKTKTIEANNSIFMKNPDIKADIINITVVHNTVFAELMIKTKGTALKVLDILIIEDSTKLIQKIEAFRQ